MSEDESFSSEYQYTDDWAPPLKTHQTKKKYRYREKTPERDYDEPDDTVTQLETQHEIENYVKSIFNEIKNYTREKIIPEVGDKLNHYDILELLNLDYNPLY